jgi:hypothetical protein
VHGEELLVELDGDGTLRRGDLAGGGFTGGDQVKNGRR